MCTLLLSFTEIGPRQTNLVSAMILFGMFLPHLPCTALLANTYTLQDILSKPGSLILIDSIDNSNDDRDEDEIENAKGLGMATDFVIGRACFSVHFSKTCYESFS